MFVNIYRHTQHTHMHIYMTRKNNQQWGRMKKNSKDEGERR